MIPLEESALTSALMIAQWLERVVILPKFHCFGIWCPLNSRYNISIFDQAFLGRYRENTFLRHPLVPRETHENVTSPILIDSSPECLSQIPLDELDNVLLFTPEDVKLGVTRHDVETWLRPYRHYKVLHFLCLYNVIQRRCLSENIIQGLVRIRH